MVPDMPKNRININNNQKDETKLKQKADNLSRFLSFPEGTFKNFPTIQIRGNREINIDGCNGIVLYENESIILETRYCNINIRGKHLSLRNLTKNILSVQGFIKNVEFTM